MRLELLVGLYVVLGDALAQEVVQTLCGKVKGRVVATEHGDVFEYVNIPYAVPPLGDLRWKHSTLLEEQRHRCWGDEVYDGSDKGTIRCPWYKSYKETTNAGTEDCLVLSVRKPKNTDTITLPVMVWVHGGGLYYGYGDEEGYYPSPEFTADMNIITVTFNYRLFAGGFMSRPEAWADGISYGNFGIGDALSAVKWVKKNIGFFGGDPKRITLLGESSGATVALGLAISPKAYDLFNNAICLSASPVWKATYEDSYNNRQPFASNLNCSKDDPKEQLACMKAVDFKTVTKEWDNSRGWGFYDFPLGDGKKGESLEYNVIEPYLIPFPPEDVASQASNKGVMSIYFGNTAQENGYNYFQYELESAKVDSWKTAEELLKSKITKFINLTENSTEDSKIPKIVAKIKKKYRFRKSSSNNWPQIFWDTITTDLRSTCPTNKLAFEMNKADSYDIYRLYIKQRPEEEVCNINYDTIHGYDTEALYGYGYYNLQSAKKRHQRKFKDNMRDIIERIVRGEEIGNWCPTENKTLVMENKMMFNIKTKKTFPQEDFCKFWEDLDCEFGTTFLEYGWQN